MKAMLTIQYFSWFVFLRFVLLCFVFFTSMLVNNFLTGEKANDIFRRFLMYGNKVDQTRRQ